MPNGLVLLDAETCKRLWALVTPPEARPIVVWRTHMREPLQVVYYQHLLEKDIPAVDAVRALVLLEDAGRIEWAKDKATFSPQYIAYTTPIAQADTPEALLLAVLDAIEGGAQ